VCTADVGIPVVNAQRLAGLIPGAKGHLFWWEDPERTAALLAAHAVS
jgi:3-oxoadipate enol-lactonase